MQDKRDGLPRKQNPRRLAAQTNSATACRANKIRDGLPRWQNTNLTCESADFGAKKRQRKG